MPDVRARALTAGGGLAFLPGDTPPAISRQQESSELWRQVGDSVGLAAALRNLARAVHYQARYEEAGHLYQESLGFYRALQDLWGQALLLNNDEIRCADIRLGWETSARALTSEAGAMLRDQGRLEQGTDSPGRRRPRPIWLGAFGLAVALIAIGWQAAVAQTSHAAHLPTLAVVERHSLTTAPDQAARQSITASTSPSGVVRWSEALTSSEPDHGSFKSVYISVTTPDHEYPCTESRPTETTVIVGATSVSEPCGASDSDTLP